MSKRPRPEEGKLMTFSCECGADEFEVVCGKSLGWGDIRDVKRIVYNDLGIREEIDGMLIIKPDGSSFWLVYPADPYTKFEPHEHDKEDDDLIDGEDGG